MLSQFRETFTGPIAWVILILLGGSFAFVGLNYNFVGNSYAAKVNGQDIGLGYYENRYSDFLGQNPQFADLDSDLRVTVRRQLLDQIIREVLISEYLAEQGYAVGDEQLAAQIREVPEFQNEDGEFDMEIYRSFLGLQSLDPSQFERLQRQRIREQQLVLSIGASALITPAEYRRYLNLLAEQRVVTLATLTSDLVNDEISVTAEQILAFYDDNASLYQLPETVDIEYISINRDEVAAGVQISEQQLLDFYEERKGDYLQDEQRQARHILILFGDDEDAAKQQADALLARVQAGEPFEDLARQYSMDGGTSSNGGDFGTLTRQQLPGELGSIIFDMQPGQIEGPVKTDFGFHIVRLDEILEQSALPLEQVRGDLLAILQINESEGAFSALERALSDALFDSSDMATIAESAGVELKSASGYTRAGGEPFGTNQVAIDTIFDSRILEQGEISDVVELDADTSAIVRVTQYNESTRQPLEAVRNQVESTLRAQQADQLMAQRADNIVTAIEDGGDFGEAAAAAGATVSEPKLFERGNREEDAAVLFSVFAAPKPTQNAPVTQAVRNQAGGYTVFSLDAVLPGRPESIPLEQRDIGKLELAQQAGRSDYVAFVEALVENATIIIDEEAIAGEGLLQ